MEFSTARKVRAWFTCAQALWDAVVLSEQGGTSGPGLAVELVIDVFQAQPA